MRHKINIRQLKSYINNLYCIFSGKNEAQSMWNKWSFKKFSLTGYVWDNENIHRCLIGV